MVATHERFSRFAAIDWSGAKGCQHRGIALAVCDQGDAAPTLISPSTRFWSRSGVLDWVRAQSDDIFIGFDFSFAPPFVTRGSYLPGDNVPEEARTFWRYVDQSCDDDDLGAASFLEIKHRRHFYFGVSDGAKADYMHNRTCEAVHNRQGGGKVSTVYDVIGAAQVAKASFAGMRLLHQLGNSRAIWPFDPLPASGPLIAEIYTTIAARSAGIAKGRSKMRDGAALDQALQVIGSAPHDHLSHYSDHATDAILTAAWLRASAHRDNLWNPTALTPKIAATEGWTFGIS